MNKLVKIGIPIKADWKDQPPSYRVFVDDELFSERLYYADPNEFYFEILQINAPVGHYQIRVDPIDSSEFVIENPRVLFGPAVMGSNFTFRIL